MALYQLVKEAWEASLRYRKDSSTAHVKDKKSSKVAKWRSLDKHSFACLQRMVHSTCMMDIARPRLQSSTHHVALYYSFYVWDSSTICFSMVYRPIPSIAWSNIHILVLSKTVKSSLCRYPIDFYGDFIYCWRFFLFKITTIPFHMCAPDAYEGPPSKRWYQTNTNHDTLQI